ncbi:MAG: lactonase family protein [bacterium]|nr:lactonase family protein [bacterium]
MVCSSPDGAQLYVASLEDDAVAVFDRDAGTGLLSFVEVHVDGGANDGLAGAAAVAVAPDGTSVYVAGQDDHGLAVFDRAPDGTLIFRQAVINGAGGVSGLAFATDVAVSHDGNYVYATGFAEDALAVFDRAADGSLTFLEVELDDEAGVDGLNGATALAVADDDGQVYATGTLDDAVAVFRRDLVAPVGSDVLVSTSHVTGVFSSAAVIDVEWSGARDDETGSGVAGYFLLLDAAPDTIPAAGAPSVFMPHGLDAHTAASAAQVDGDRWVHLLTCDHAGNCAAAVHAGPFSVDATPPAPPSGLTSPSHGLAGAPSNAASVEVAWTAATDGLGGLGGYGYAFDVNPAWSCDFTQPLPAAAVADGEDASVCSGAGRSLRQHRNGGRDQSGQLPARRGRRRRHLRHHRLLRER